MALAAGWLATGWAAEPPWPPHLLVQPGPGREAVTVLPKGLTTPWLQVFPPGSGSWESRREGEGIPVKVLSGQGGYHWLATTWEQDGITHVASTAHFFALPGPAPTRMLAQAKHALELVPHPLPREYQRYRAGETWPFLVRWQGQPLVHAEVTRFAGSLPAATFHTNANGVARVTLPATTGRSASADQGRHGIQVPFVLHVTHVHGEHRYVTTFSHTFGNPPPTDLAMGLAASTAGLILASVALRRRQEEP